ncbi:BPSS1780 family membrane protein [Denitratisoma sp. agr-D3]
MQARRLPARHGLLWLLAGFGLLRRNPPLLISLTLGYWLLFALLLQGLPLMGSLLLPLFLPLVTLIIANGNRAVAEGRAKPMSRQVLLAGIDLRHRSLLQLCGLNLAASALAVLVSAWLLGDVFDSGDALQKDPGALLLLMGELLLITSPLLLAFWFSPLLTGWDSVPALKSLFFSLVACLRNWRAFAVYGLAAAGIGVVVPSLFMALLLTLAPDAAQVLFTVLRMAFLLLLAPALMAGAYLGYRDIFSHE